MGKETEQLPGLPKKKPVETISELVLSNIDNGAEGFRTIQQQLDLAIEERVLPQREIWEVLSRLTDAVFDSDMEVHKKERFYQFFENAAVSVFRVFLEDTRLEDKDMVIFAERLTHIVGTIQEAGTKPERATALINALGRTAQRLLVDLKKKGLETDRKQISLLSWVKRLLIDIRSHQQQFLADQDDDLKDLDRQPRGAAKKLLDHLTDKP